GADDAPPSSGTVLGAFAANQSALRVERVAVGAAAVVAKNRHGAARVHLQDTVSLDVAEKDISLTIDPWTFQETDARRDGNFRVLRKQIRRQRSFGQIGHLGGSRGNKHGDGQ